MESRAGHEKKYQSTSGEALLLHGLCRTCGFDRKAHYPQGDAVKFATAVGSLDSPHAAKHALDELRLGVKIPSQFTIRVEKVQQA